MEGQLGGLLATGIIQPSSSLTAVVLFFVERIDKKCEAALILKTPGWQRGCFSLWSSAMLNTIIVPHQLVSWCGWEREISGKISFSTALNSEYWLLYLSGPGEWSRGQHLQSYVCAVLLMGFDVMAVSRWIHPSSIWFLTGQFSERLFNCSILLGSQNFTGRYVCLLGLQLLDVQTPCPCDRRKLRCPSSEEAVVHLFCSSSQLSDGWFQRSSFPSSPWWMTKVLLFNWFAFTLLCQPVSEFI